MTLQSLPQIAGSAEGEVLRLAKPISFWGGVDPRTGRISDPRHPNHDSDIAGRILVLPGMIGSSPSSYIMLELMAIRRARRPRTGRARCHIGPRRGGGAGDGLWLDPSGGAVARAAGRNRHGGKG